MDIEEMEVDQSSDSNDEPPVHKAFENAIEYDV